MEKSAHLSCLRADKEPDPTLEQSLLNAPLMQTEETDTQELVLAPELLLDIEQQDLPELQDIPNPESILHQSPELQQSPVLQQLPEVELQQTPDVKVPSTPERPRIQPTRRSEGFRSRSSRRRSNSPVPSPVKSPRQSLRDRHEADGGRGSPLVRARGYRCRNNCSADITFSTLGSRNRHEAHDCPVTRQVCK